MATTANIQTDGNTAVQHTNKIMEGGTMNHENNNINTVSRLSNGFGFGSISKFVAAAALGLALTIGLAMPGAARADSPAVTAFSSSVSDLWNDDFSSVYGIPDNGLGRSAVNASPLANLKINTNTDFWNDDFSMVYGTPDALAKLKVNTVSNIDNMNDDFSLVYGTPDAPAKLKVNTVSNIDNMNDDFSMVYSIPDINR